MIFHFLRVKLKNMTYSALDLPKAGDTVVVGLSGGVDSTLTALLLKEKGCHVIGVTMSLWDGKLPDIQEGKVLRESCYGPGENENIEQCKKFCSDQNIEYHVIDVKEEYQNKVLEYFKSEYRNGRTPNPCIRCNRYIKFGALLSGIQKLNIDYDYFCTGHYAKVVRPDEGIYGTDKKPCMIHTALDLTKDQTYFISRVPSNILEKVRFPLAELSKAQVYELARKANLSAADREESQDFVPPEYFDMLFSDKPSVPGNIIDLDGKILGKHRGIEHYTIGQRRGLGVSSPKPLYVHSIDAVNNLVVLASNEDLNAEGLIADDFVWPGNIEPPENFSDENPDIFVKIRLASKPVKAKLEKINPDKSDINCDKFNGQAWRVIFNEPQRAVAPGQSVVIYDKNVIIGSGIIVSAIQ